MYNDSLLSKIQLKKFYKLPSGNVVRVIRVDKIRENVIVHNYHSHSNEIVDFKITPILFKRVYKIGEVAKMFGKKTSTIRKYENMGLIPAGEKISLHGGGKLETRVYSERQVEELAEFFRRRRSAGRPPDYKNRNIRLNQKD
jgi:hypothetical protein